MTFAMTKDLRPRNSCEVVRSVERPIIRYMTNTQRQVTRRRLLEGLAGLVAASALPGCANSVFDVPLASLAPSGSKSSQPMPNGGLTAASVTVSGIRSGMIGQAFAGLAYEKVMLT